jgi:hypothetical protein
MGTAYLCTTKKLHPQRFQGLLMQHLAGKVRNVTFAMCPRAKHVAFLVLFNGSRLRGRITTKGVIEVSHSISLVTMSKRSRWY